MTRSMTRALVVLVALGALACGGGSSTVDATPDATPDAPADVTPSDVDAEDALDKDPGGPEADVPRPEIDDEVTDPAVQAAIDQGKYWLSNAEPWMAREAFEQALALAPSSVDARFGAGLAQLVYGAEQFLTIFQMLTGQAFGFPPPPVGILPLPQQTENDYLAEALHTLLNELRAELASAEAHFDALGDLELAWDIDGVPLYAGVRPVMIFRGTYTRTDLELIRAVTDVFVWVCDLLVAQDFHTDVMTVISFVKDADDLDVWILLNTLGYLLDQDPRFFQLREDDGLALADDGYLRLKGVGQHLLAAFERLDSLEPTEQTISYVDPAKPADTLIIRNKVDHSKAAGPEEVPLTMTFTPKVRTTYENVLAAIEVPGSLATWDDTLAQIATLVVGLSKTGLLAFLLGDLIPIDLSSLEIHQAIVVVNNLVPAPIALDWGTFHQHPVGLRAVLPKIEYDPEGANPSNFLIEWECPDEVAANDGQAAGAAGFICTADAVLADAPHFVGTPYEIPADGVVSRLPYLVWDDPTIGGLLFVDPSLVDGAISVEPGFAPADNFTLNLALRGMLDGIIDMFVK